MRKLELVVAGFAALALAQNASAQGRGHDRDDDRIPPGQRPSPGMCRIWINGVPPGRQPQQTDCATARATVPPNATIIYGGGPERRVYTSNGTVVLPSRIPNGAGLPSRIPNASTYPNTTYPYGYPSQAINPVVAVGGRQCVQYTDVNGRARYDCSAEAVNRQLACNANPSSSACSGAYINGKKHKKHKDKDHEGDRDNQR